MNAIATDVVPTPEELLRMPGFELVDGKLRERTMSFLSSFVATRVSSLLERHVHSRGLGWVVGPDTSFQCFTDDQKRVRRVDSAYLKATRLSVGDALNEGHCKIAPDLVVEVISPNDLAYEVEEKVEQWLDSGVQVVWVINPKLQRVSVRSRTRPIQEFRGEEVISEEGLLPGFHVPVAEFFKMPKAAG